MKPLLSIILLVFVIFSLGCKSEVKREKGSQSNAPKKKDLVPSGFPTPKADFDSSSIDASLDIPLEQSHGRKIKKIQEIEPLRDTGIVPKDMKISKYAKGVMSEIELELKDVSSEEGATTVLLDILGKYWERGFSEEISVEDISFWDVFGQSEKFVHNVKNDIKNEGFSEEQHKSIYAIVTILELVSEADSPKIKGIFWERLNDSVMRKGDLYLVQAANHITPFRGDNHTKNLETLDQFKNARNPAFRALAVVYGKVFLKDEQVLLNYLNPLTKDSSNAVSILTLNELASYDTPRAWQRIEEIAKNTHQMRKAIVSHAEALLEQR